MTYFRVNRGCHAVYFEFAIVPATTKEEALEIVKEAPDNFEWELDDEVDPQAWEEIVDDQVKPCSPDGELIVPDPLNLQSEINKRIQK
jgi:hypothetical protein